MLRRGVVSRFPGSLSRIASGRRYVGRNLPPVIRLRFGECNGWTTIQRWGNTGHEVPAVAARSIAARCFSLAARAPENTTHAPYTLAELKEIEDADHFITAFTRELEIVLPQASDSGQPKPILELLQILTNCSLPSDAKLRSLMEAVAEEAPKAIMEARKKLLLRSVAASGLAISDEDFTYLDNKGNFLVKKLQDVLHKYEMSPQCKDTLRKVLTTMEYSPEYDNPLWDLMLRAMADERKDECRYWMNALAGAGVMPTVSTYLSMYHIHLGFYQVKKAKAVWQHMDELGYRVGQIVHNLSFWPNRPALIRQIKVMIGDNASQEEIIELLVLLQETDQENFLHYFRAGMRGLAQKRSFDVISEVLGALHREGLKPTEETVQTVLEAYSHCGHLNGFRNLRQVAVEQGFLTPLQAEKSYLRCCCYGQDLAEVEASIRYFVKSRTLTLQDGEMAMAAFDRGKDLRRAENLLRWMKRMEIPLSVRVYNHHLNLLRRLRRTKDLERVFAELKASGLEPNMTTITILLSHYTDNKDFDAAESLLDQLEQEGRFIGKFLKASFYKLSKRFTSLGIDFEDPKEVFNTVHKIAQGELSIYRTTFLRLLSNATKAEEFVELMLEHGVQPDPRIYAVLASRLTTTKEPRRAQKWIVKLKESKDLFFGSDPELLESNLYLAVCEAMNDFKGAKQILGAMKERGLIPDKNTYLPFIGLYFRFHTAEALKLVDKMTAEGIKLDTRDYNRLLRAAVAAASPAGAHELLRRMQEEGIPFDEETFTQLSNLYWHKPRRETFEEAEKLLDEMQRRGMVPQARMVANLVDMAFATKDVGKFNYYLDVASTLGYQESRSVVNRVLQWFALQDQMKAVLHVLERLHKHYTRTHDIIDKTTRKILRDQFFYHRDYNKIYKVYTFPTPEDRRQFFPQPLPSKSFIGPSSPEKSSRSERDEISTAAYEPSAFPKPAVVELDAIFLPALERWKYDELKAQLRKEGKEVTDWDKETEERRRLARQLVQNEGWEQVVESTMDHVDIMVQHGQGE